MEKRIYKDTQNARLDQYLAKELDLSRSKIQSLIKDGHILLNNTKVKSGALLSMNDEIFIDIPKSRPLAIKAENIPLNIVYEDDDLIIVNKPKGMVTHPALGNYEGTLVNALLYHFENLSSLNGELRPGIVHRLDKDTSGLLVVAKNNESHIALSKQLEDKTCFRRYIALVYGEISVNEGIIEAPIGRDEKNRQIMAVSDKNSKYALTHFKVLKRYHGLTLVDVELKTGRTHQIRAHFKYIKHPIFNDNKYTKRKVLDDSGQFLHAYYLSFIHPKTGQRVHFKAEIPPYMSNYLKTLDPEYDYEHLVMKGLDDEREL